MKNLNQYILEHLECPKLSILEHLECPKLSILEHLECPKLSILERLFLNKDTKTVQYMYHPKDFDELRSLLEQLFEERGKDADLNDIDVSEITSFGNEITTGKYKGYWGLFYGLDPHNIKIDRWDVSNVEDMSNMFFNCKNFTGQGLENWKPLKCRNMYYMMYGCDSLKNRPSWYKE